MNWLKEKFEEIKYRDFNKQMKKTYKKKWEPLLDKKRYDFKLDSKIFNILLQPLSEFVDIFSEIDGMRPYVSSYNSPSFNPTLYGTPQLYEPEGWINFDDMIDMFFKNLKLYENINRDINLEIEKEYYNILTGKVSYLLKTDDGLKMDYVVKYEHDEHYIKEINEIIKDTEIFILNPDKRNQIERKMKIRRLLNSK